MTPNMHIISNLMTFNTQGVITGFEGELIHSFNKNSTALHGTEFLKHCEERRNVLLVGDSIGDANMANGLDYDEILRVGYLNAHEEERMEKYLDRFDVVILGDGGLEPVQSFLDLILAQNDTNAASCTSCESSNK